MDRFSFYILANILVLIHKQEGYSLAAVSDNAASVKASPAEPGSRAPRREKRCSCQNLMDRECVYFCHIGIMWVNTPGEVVPYGIGPPPVRLRRDIGKCVCANSRDSGCRQFCKTQVGIKPSGECFRASLGKKYEQNLRELEHYLFPYEGSEEELKN